MKGLIFKIKERIKKSIKPYFKSRLKEDRHKLVGSPKNWKQKQRFQIKFLIENGLKKDDLFLDIGCGTLRGGIPIIRFLDEEKYYGIDIRENVINEAHHELKEEKLVFKKPFLLTFEDFEDLSIKKKFDKILAFSVLIHLEDSILHKCLSFVSNHLSTQNGVFYANVNYGDKPDSKWLEYPVVFKNKEFYKDAAAKYNMAVREIGRLKDIGHKTTDELSDNQMMLEFKLLK